MSDIALASMGSGALIIENDQVLLVRLNYGPAKGQFILPGGMVEKNEHPHQACLRELKEETGLNGDVISQLSVRHRINKKGRLNIYWVFVCKNLSPPDTPFIFSKDEIQEVCFMDIKEALISPEVRPNTQVFIQMALNQNKDILKNYNESNKDYIYT